MLETVFALLVLSWLAWSCSVSTSNAIGFLVHLIFWPTIETILYFDLQSSNYFPIINTVGGLEICPDLSWSNVKYAHYGITRSSSII